MTLKYEVEFWALKSALALIGEEGRIIWADSNWTVIERAGYPL